MTDIDNHTGTGKPPDGATQTREPAAEESKGLLRGKLGLVLACLAGAQFLVALDYTSVYVALPSIGSQFSLPGGQLSWVIAAYAVCFAGFLLVGGRAGDMFGAKKIFVISLSLFAAGSLISFFADDFGVLIGSRALQGIGAGLLDPSTLGLIGLSFPAGKVRNKALAIWGTSGAVGLAIGVVLSGVMTATLSWHWVFMVNVVLAALIAVGALAFLPSADERIRANTRLNLPSALLGTIAVMLLVFGITRAGDVGWTSAATWIGIGAAVVVFGGFVLRERTTTSPLIDPSLLRTGSLLVGCAATGLYLMAFNSKYFLATLYLQDEKGFGPLWTGLALLPLALAMTAGNMLTAKMADRHGPRRPLVIGLVIGAVGLVALAVSVLLGAGFVWFLIAMIIAGIGSGMAFAATFMVGTMDIEAKNQGVGSAMMTTAHHTGGVLGISVYVLVLGQSPGVGSFFWAFVVAAAIGLGTAVFSRAAVRTSQDA